MYKGIGADLLDKFSSAYQGDPVNALRTHAVVKGQIGICEGNYDKFFE